ncbi:MAG: cytochrome c-type biogenesis protein [Rhodovibrionaceae bacterium]
MRLAAALALLLLAGLSAWGPALAVEPEEMLDDPELEARARDISKDVRCVVCQNESIDSSNAGIARDLRILIRERLQTGDSDREVFDFLTARYGDFVLLKPPVRPATYLLWFGPAAVLILGGLGLAVFLLRRRRPAAQSGVPELTPEERGRLAKLLKERRE